MRTRSPANLLESIQRRASIESTVMPGGGAGPVQPPVMDLSSPSLVCFCLRQYGMAEIYAPLQLMSRFPGLASRAKTQSCNAFTRAATAQLQSGCH